MVNLLCWATKPVLGMLHLGGGSRRERLYRAAEEVDALVAGGVDGVVVENYFGDVDDVVAVLDRFDADPPGISVGINVLRDTRRAFALARHHHVDFIQVDSVCGHLEPAVEAAFVDELARERASVDALLLGGVRFKYQPLLSGRTEREDVELGTQRCDAVVVTGAGTGQVTATDKLERYREAVGPTFALVVGAGITPELVAEQLAVADGAIVGSYLKDTYRDTGVVDRRHVESLMAAVARARGEST